MLRATVVAGAVGVTLFTAVLARPAPLRAAPLYEPHVGGMVFVGPVSPHVSAIYWNPAAAGLMRGTHVFFSGIGNMERLGIDRADIDSSNGEPATDATPEVNRKRFDAVTAYPITPGAFIGISSDLNTDRVTLGLAFYSPFGEQQPGGGDDTTLQYHTRGGSFYGLYGTFSVSWRVTARLIVGVSLSTVRTRTDLRFAQDAALAGCAGTTGCAEDPQGARQIRASSSLFDTDFWSVAYHGGALLRVTPRLWLGATYMSPAYEGLARDISETGEAGVDPPPADMLPHADGESEVSFRLPQSLILGTRYAAVEDEWYLLGSLRWTDLSEHRIYDVRLSGRDVRAAGVDEWITRYRGFQDVYSLDLGLENPPGRAVRLGARVKLETSSVPEAAVSPAQVDGLEASIAGGVELRVSPSWSLTLASSVGAQLPVSVGRSDFSPQAQIDCVQSGYDLDTCEPSRDGRAISTAAGDYSRLTFGLMLGLSFDRL